MACAFLTICTLFPLYAGSFDRTMTLIRIMEQSDLEYKTELLETAFDSSDRMVASFASENLKKTMDGEYSGQAPETVDAFKEVLVSILGETNALEDADLLFTIFSGSDNSQLVRTATEALGKIGAVQYADSITDFMEDSNSKQYFLLSQGYENMLRENEKNAWSAVLALERLHTKECYEPLFHAQFSGYTKESGVKERAAQAMTVVVRNPTSVLKDISDREHSSEGRTLILDLSSGSNALDVQKVDLAAYIFSETIVNDYEFGDYMINACAIIEKSPYKVRGTEAALKKILYGSYNPAFTDLAIKAAPHCQNGVTVLSDYLKEQNQRTMEGSNVYQNHQVVLMVIKALGNSGDSNAIDQLIVAKNADTGWPLEIAKAADAALNNLLAK